MPNVSRPVPLTIVRFHGIGVVARALSVRHVAGAANVNSATFEIQTRKNRLDAATETTEQLPQESNRIWLEDLALGDIFHNKVVDVQIQDQARVRRRIHRGRVAAVDPQFSDDGEMVIFHSRTDKHLFGSPWVRTPMSSFPTLERSREDDVPAICNPTWNGLTVPNRIKLSPSKKGGSSRVTWIDPECLPRFFLRHSLAGSGISVSPISTIAGVVDMSFWTLREIVEKVCDVLNPETYIANPTSKELQKAMGKVGDDKSLVRDFRIPVGEYLPEILDRLLIPFGFNWYVEFEPKVKIRVFKRGSGKPVALKLQRRGEYVDYTKTAVSACNLRFDAVDRAANRIRLLGDYEEVEGTFELIPAWDPKYDKTPSRDLDANSKAEFADPALRRVWADWVLNEGGDYNGLRDSKELKLEGWPAHVAEMFDDAFDLNPLFQLKHAAPKTTAPKTKKAPKRGTLPLIEKRRRFHPTITLAPDGTPYGAWGGLYVEYSTDGGEVWQPWNVPGTSIQPLRNECGIRIQGNFSGGRTPLRRTPLSKLRIRVTGTLRNDLRIEATPRLVGKSWLADTLEEVIDVSASYHLRRILKPKKAHIDFDPVTTVGADGEASEIKVTPRNYGSVLYEIAGALSSATDDRTALLALASQMLDSWKLATLTGTVEIAGIDYDLGVVGHSVTGLGQRKVSFNVAPGLKPRFPDIVGVDYDIQNQKTILTIESYR